MSTSKKVIILDKVNSPIIAQAILILRDNANDDFSAVLEAERIVSDYLYRLPEEKPKNRLPFIIAAAVACVVTAVLYFSVL